MAADIFQTQYLPGYEFSWVAIRFLTVGSICVLVGAFILYRERASAAGRVYFIYTLSLALWLIGASFGFASPNPSAALFWGDIAHLGVMTIPATILHFSVLSMGIASRHRRLITWTWFIAMTFLVLNLFWPGFIGDPYHYEWGYYPHYKLGGIFFALFFLTIMTIVLFHFYNTVKQSLPGTALRQRATLLLIGFIGGGVAFVDFLATFGLNLNTPFGDLPVLFLLLITTIVTIKYRLAEFVFGQAARRVFEAMTDALVVFNSDNIIRVANSAAEDLFGKRSLTGLSLPKISVGTEINGQLQANIRASYSGPKRITVPLDSGAERILSISTSTLHDGRDAAVGSICLISDVSEQHQNDELLRHAQKMESLGVMAGGVAHDFNNILLAILGNLELGSLKLEKNSPALPYLDQVARAAHRATDLVSKMLTYTGGVNVEKKELDLNTVIREAKALIPPDLAGTIEIELDLSDDLPAVLCDRIQLQQMIVNLTTNGLEALGNTNGTISVSTDLKDVDAEFIKDAQFGKSMPNGVYVRLVVTDSGEGMSAQTLQKIFDPFFSTRFIGRGLGLPAVSGAVRAHGGILKVKSSPDEGSSFTVLLPTFNTQ